MIYYIALFCTMSCEVKSFVHRGVLRARCLFVCAYQHNVMYASMCVYACEV